ncbi:hypothetical protein FHS28_002370 [Roseateles terrae]|uniref:Uncharacterized protein n=1 Tax=Roseateles terrae TaxID=431060 RepID=A0ABR6GS73_9BURK|nr:hypothetical protein [Roseateles terrae]
MGTFCDAARRRKQNRGTGFDTEQRQPGGCYRQQTGALYLFPRAVRSDTGGHSSPVQDGRHVSHRFPDSASHAHDVAAVAPRPVGATGDRMERALAAPPCRGGSGGDDAPRHDCQRDGCCRDHDAGAPTWPAARGLAGPRRGAAFASWPHRRPGPTAIQLAPGMGGRRRIRLDLAVRGGPGDGAVRLGLPDGKPGRPGGPGWVRTQCTPASSAAFPPAAAVLIVSVCSAAKR